MRFWAYLVAGFAVVALVVVLTGGDLVGATAGWFHGAFGTTYNLTQTLVYATPLVLVALGVSVALRASVVSVGGEGQMIAGAIAATVVLLSPAGSSPLALPLGALAGAAGGAIWALLPGLALVRWGVSEILTTLLCNYLAAQLLAYLLRTSLRDKVGAATPQSASLPDAALLPMPFQIILALVLAAAAVWWHRSRSALLLDVFASRRWLAERLGVGAGRAMLATMLVSGAAAGLAGWVQLAGVDGRLDLGISGGIGFSGLIVAVLGRSRPGPILVAAVVFAALTTGANGIQFATGIPAAIGTVTQAVLLGAVALAVTASRRSGRSW
ncbi:ABC transporter permease [Kutzneria buriramensis]|uniref:Simple sugar transport system permease protein n=1 Tax=Kutzneria buriramensis TaxID=1045776 RepID=A0A3E0HDK9_9PSEU|nr:ABC transporter permease [Kutzneria buriramensis]REH42898.1 simple sugar transport system permease protein [Kutzneria buriramensis]